jgi:hypothetical protein
MVSPMQITRIKQIVKHHSYGSTSDNRGSLDVIGCTVDNSVNVGQLGCSTETAVWILVFSEVAVDTRTFITKLVCSLVWPLTVLICVAFLRKPLSYLITLIRTLKYSDFEVQFGKDVAELKRSAAAASIQPEAVKSVEAKSAWEDLVRLASERPRTAIRKAWDEVETSLERLAKQRNLEAAPPVWHMPMVLGALLLNVGALSQHQYELLSKLRQLVSEAERAPIDSLNPEDAVEFVGLALPFAASMRPR